MEGNRLERGAAAGEGAGIAERIAAFLESIGLSVRTARLPETTFLPGIESRDGALWVDADRLRFPGDLLHEAGHLAVLPPALRARFGGEGELPGVDMGQLEVQAIAWSYAAVLHLGIDPALVFHEGGYRGHARGLLHGFALGVYYGVGDLEAAGLTAGAARAAELGVPPYPHMIAWLRG